MLDCCLKKSGELQKALPRIRRASGVHTQVLDVNHARVPQTGIIDGRTVRAGNHAAIATLGDAQAVNRGVGDLSNDAVQLLARCIVGNGDFPGKLADRLACRIVSLAGRLWGYYEGSKTPMDTYPGVPHSG